MWVLYGLGATFAIAMSDVYRKLSSNFTDPYLNNLVFQIGSIGMAIALWLFYSRKAEQDSLSVVYALAGGMFVSVFTALFFKALSMGPGISTVAPVVRIGGLVVVVLLGVFFLREKVTLGAGLGMSLAVAGLIIMSMSR
jgi:uncharacterized membrane protein